MKATATIQVEGTPEELSEMVNRVDSIEPAGKGHIEVQWDKNVPYPPGKTTPL